MAGDDELVVSPDLRIPVRELDWRFGPSSGPGGQHANRTHTRAEVRFDIAGSESLHPADRERLLARFGPTVTVAADDERSQSRNRRTALDRLARTLRDALRRDATRHPTRPSRGSVEARLAAKRRRAARKAERRRPTED